MKTRHRYIMLPIVLIALLAALSIPVSAGYGPSVCPCVTKYTGTINGDIYYKYYGGTFSQSESTVFTDVPDGIITAKVYTGVWGGSPGSPSCPDGGTFQIEVNGYTSPGYVACDPGEPEEDRCNIVNEPECRDSVTGCQVHHITYDATPYIVSGDNTVTVTTSNTGCCGSWDGRIYFIALLVVHEDASMPEITYWINEGAVYMDVGSGCSPHADEAFFYFNGTISPASVNNVEYWTYGEPNNLEVNPDLNGNNIGNPDPDPEYRVKWNHIPPAYLDASSNLFYYYDPAGCYNRAQFGVLILEHGESSPDLEPRYTGIWSVMRPNKDYTINATVENIGGNASGPFNVSLDIAGTSYHKEVNVTTGLGAGNNTTVSFDEVNLTEGCYDFIVTVDCNGDVTEDNEFNNVATKKYQVGYVIVVDRNSDFERLDVSGDMALPAGCFANVGGTYYIRNLDIENCAEGDGVHITNTTVPFVIRNCTIHDCTENGVYFNNVTNGKVNESEIRDNGLKGIRMENCSYVTIETNSVHDNTAFGVDVYMDTMPYLDSHHITISNNTITGGMYGIEVLGNDCTVRCNTIEGTTSSYAVYVSGNYSKIHNNTIQNNVGYGIQVDSTWIQTIGNLIYGNDFIGNNGGGVQAFDNGTNTRWNTSTMVNYYYNNNGTRHNYTGNYWSDYYGNLYNESYLPNPNCTDSNGDGIGDSIPYAIDGGAGAADNYPMVVPWWVCGDVNGDGRSDTNDLNPLFDVDLTTSQWAGDVNCQGSGSCLGCVNTNDLNPLFYTDLHCCRNCCDGSGCCTCIGCCCNPT